MLPSILNTFANFEYGLVFFDLDNFVIGIFALLIVRNGSKSHSDVYLNRKISSRIHSILSALICFFREYFMRRLLSDSSSSDVYMSSSTLSWTGKQASFKRYPQAIIAKRRMVSDIRASRLQLAQYIQN